MNFGGLLGHVELEGDLAPLAALLRTAEIVHVGKGATFGLGKVEIAVQQSTPVSCLGK
jgi:CRISPR/Cas system endoribonuclease Cas6 (RAMP superfamily)